MSELSVIITMAGEGSRFKQEGYTIPKYMILVKGKTLFEWSMDSLNGLDISNLIFVVKKEDNSYQFIKDHIKQICASNVQIVELESKTDGQASTALIGMEHIDAHSKVLIYNIDTYVEPPFNCIPAVEVDGFIPCFKAAGDHWSFIAVDSSNNVTSVEEKRRISDLCTIGAYYFSSVSLYREMYNQYYCKDSNLVSNEKYIAPMYNCLISLGYTVGYSLIPFEKVHVLGTPEELNVFAQNTMKV